jgi:hypothetical protein
MVERRRRRCAMWGDPGGPLHPPAPSTCQERAFRRSTGWGAPRSVMPAGRHERPAKPFEKRPVKRSVPRTLTDWFMDGMMPILPTLTQAGGWCRASGLFSNHNPTSRRRFMQRPIVTTHCTLQACKEDHGSPPFTRSERTMCFFHLILWASLPSGFWRSSVEPPPAQKIICRPG